MVKKKAESQTDNLILDHKMSGIDPTSVRAGGVQHIVGKLSMRATTLL
jgi:ABC-type lipopolysaccharide export system ATPase subunit